MAKYRDGSFRIIYLVFMVTGCLMLFSNPVSAEIYRYRDANGVLHYTDNIALVPQNQRSGALYDNSQAPSAPPAENVPVTAKEAAMDAQKLETLEKPPTDNPEDVSSQAEGSSVDPSKIDRLVKLKAQLDAENAQLVKESLALYEEKKTLSGNAAIKAYNEKVGDLNVRMEDFEKRRAAFQKEADALDASVKERLTAPPPSPQPKTP